jgi:hypothetical protein
MAKIVLLDTNFMLIPGQFRVDIFSEIRRVCDFDYTLAVLDRCLEELGNLAKKGAKKDREAAILAVRLLKRKDLKIIRTKSNKPVDDLLADYAERGAIIATQDSALKKNIKDRNGRIIFLRSKKFLQME